MREFWISYFLQDGTQCGVGIMTSDINAAEQILMEKHGDMYGGIADYGYYDELEG